MKTNRIKFKNPVYWWDEECNKAKRLRRAMYKKWEHTKYLDLEDLIKFKKAVAESRKTFRLKKKNCFREFAANIDGRYDINYMWKTSKILKNRWINNVNNNVTENLQSEEKENIALNKLSPPWCITNPKINIICPPNPHFDKPFILNELQTALKLRNSKSSPGVDGINYMVLKKLPSNLKLTLLNIYNELYQTGEFPEEWKQHHIHFIKKSDGNVDQSH